MAEIVTILRRADGTAASGQKVLFRRDALPANASPATITAGDVSAVADGTGAISIGLVAGNYLVWVGSSRRRAITVPNDAGPYLLEELLDEGLTGAAITPTPTTQNQLFADPSAFAGVTVSPLVKFVLLLQDAQLPSPSSKVWFVREGTAAAVDGVNVIADQAGTTFTRVQ